jgi:hypothetical protein
LTQEAGTTAEKLRNSILANGGIMQPIIVRKQENGQHLCVEGNTRLYLYRTFARDKLEDEPAISVRSPSIILAESTPLPALPEEMLKRRRIQQLITNLERTRGFMPGTISVGAVGHKSVVLVRDWLKLREAVGVSIDMPVNSAVTETTAELEYDVSIARERARTVVGLKVGNEIIVEGYHWDDSAISVNLPFGSLSARQIGAGGLGVPVEVRVGGVTRVLKWGEVARVGDLEVRILKSVHFTKDFGHAGPPYVLRLRAVSVR